MAKEIVNLLLIAFVITMISAAPAEDEVKFPISGYNNHKWYSGYLNFTTGDFHYVFFDSQRDPDNDPLVLWLNGGPGCSSLIGLFLENGPFVFEKNSFDLKLNQFSWNKKANVLYIQTPGTVGFSKGLRFNNTYDDKTTAEDNYNALIDFFRKFPNLKKNQFYITGESYAGIYIPYLAMQIIQKNKLPSVETKINFKGIMIGNACTDRRECYQPTYGGLDGDGMSIYQYEFLHNHAYITDGDYDFIRGACTLGYESQGCIKIRKKVNQFFASTNTVINNIYQPCYHQKIPTAAPKILQGRGLQLQSYQTCQDLKGILHFLNEPIMQINLHVQLRPYQICNDQVASRYTMNQSASQWIYPILIKEKIKIMIYSGDVDANVPITGTLKWINLSKDVQGWPVIQPWRQWWVPGLHKHEDQVAGMVWKLKGLTFVSVKGAGHMAPRDKPKQTLVMFESFIFNNDLPYKSQ